MSAEEVIKGLSDVLGNVYDYIAGLFLKLSIPVAAYLGILTKLIMDLSSKKTTYIGAFIGMIVSVAVLYVSAPLLSKVSPSSEWFAVFAFILGTTALSIVKWINDTDRVKSWLNHIETFIIDWLKSKFKK